MRDVEKEEVRMREGGEKMRREKISEKEQR